MASLRRPSAAIPKGQGGHGPIQSGPRPPMPGDHEKKRDARKSKVGDKIRKRMSMRYMGADQLPPSAVPPLPTQGDFLDSDPYGGADFTPLPDDAQTGETYFNQFGSPEFQQSAFGGAGRVSDRDEGDAEQEGIRRRGAEDLTREEEFDLAELDKEDFDINDYLRRTLTGADEEEKKRFKAALMREKGNNQKELQKNVFRHYAEFVTISKEISTLENDMLDLKELLGQWKDLPQLMGMQDTLAPTLDKSGNIERRRTQRNSVMDLQNLYKSQLTQLWSTVEGSQKYLPLVPGRHLVFETHNFVELNAATYKAKQNVSMFLLNDLLLIAGRRRMKSAATSDGGDKERERGRMVAERCWVLADLVVVDVKDSGDLTNALKIRRGKEVCVYRTSKPEDKKSLLAAFRQVSQELGEKKRKESEKEQERRKSMWHGEKPGGTSHGAPALPGMMSPGRPLSTIGMSMADSKDLRWIDEYGDELTMAIARRDWEESVKLAERGRDLLKTVSSNQSALALLTAKLDQLSPTLMNQILHDLSSAQIRKNQTATLVSYLARLNCADQARDVFLKSRKELMLKRIRSIKCEGDISIYNSELSVVCFTIIRHTSDWFMNAFKENMMASGFTTWAKEQIETFADMFRRQVYAPNVEQSVVDECLRVTASQNRKLLRDVGLDFTYLLSTLLQPDPSIPGPNAIFNNFNTSTFSGNNGNNTRNQPSPQPQPQSTMTRQTSGYAPSMGRSDSAAGYQVDAPTQSQSQSASYAGRDRSHSNSSRDGGRAGNTAPLNIPSRQKGTGIHSPISPNSGQSSPLPSPATLAGSSGGPTLPMRSDRRGNAPSASQTS
uniref:Exocyst complex component EXO84 n=1 Tax=Kwoniella dejecticola CBS 10117 TaxID=1296121 RepID=A0A1A5ZUE3_9TREE|nr:exocyst complex component EXO84 [Kwoniella dejecticola CBS 10117]OBR81420.1 exocyst complex component EXO84 [Kwoniella dejecticola CBS 10117]